MCLAMLFACTVFAFAYEGENYVNFSSTSNVKFPVNQHIAGDANGDGNVSVADARKLVVALAKNDTQALLEFGDVNNDGNISVADARKIVVAIAKNDFNF